MDRSRVAVRGPRGIGMQNTEQIWRLVDAKQDAFIELSDRIWAMPELNFQEVRSAHEHADMLRAEGFRAQPCNPRQQG